MMKKVRPATETDLDEVPGLAKARLTSQAKRAQKAHAYDEKLIGKLLEQLGVTREELEKRADADFAQAKSESVQRLKQLRALQRARIKKRGPLRARIEATFAQFGRTEVLK
jgi:predicted component of type VI protein secretion system